MNFKFCVNDSLLIKQIIAKPPKARTDIDWKKEFLMWKKTMLKKVKSYKNNNMNSAKVNFIYLIKENFVQ